jgi:TonB-linked SusC/RagA family outer membrane protein
MQLTANVRQTRQSRAGKSGQFIRSGSYANGFNRKLLRGMKLTATLLVITCLHAAAHMKGQTVTLSVKNVPVQKVFREVSRQTGISIVYNEGMFEGLKPVTIKVNQVAIKDVLEQCFQGQPFEYNLLGNTIVIKKKPDALVPFTGIIMPLPPPPPVRGKVLNEKGEGIAGANVQVKGSRKGTTTGANGEFTIEADKGDKLIISYVGYFSQEVAVGDDKNITISLAMNTQNLGELVVTALGIQRRSKSLTYSTQKVTNAELTTVKDINPINSLNGKVAGLQINRSASGLGGSARVVLRGQKSTRENQPLYVIDGVPMANIIGSQPTDVWGQSSGINSIGRDGGDVLSSINPEDIESITVLKGASAAALYGSQAGNGVILITTKKGKSGIAKIDFSSNFTLEKPMYYPELQYDYKQTGKDNIYSWGDAQSSPDHVKPFFKTGNTWINTLSLTAGNEKAQTYFSYSNTSNKGILPTSELDQHTFNFRETAKLLNDKLTLDANILFSTQKIHNRPSSGLYFNPLTGLYLFPRGLNFDDYKNFEVYSSKRNLMLQNWWNINDDKGDVGQDNQQNPYWVVNRNLSIGKKDNLFSSITLKYPITKWLSVQARGSLNRNYDNYEFKAYASTQITLSDANGRYTVDRLTNTLLYGDLIFSGNADISQKIGFNFNAGTSINDLKQDRDFIDTKGGDLRFANIFTLGNVNLNPSLLVQPTGLRRQVQSIFGTATFDYDDKIYLDLTARNDWSSTLAFTPKVNSGYPYFSAGLNTIITDLVQLPAVFSYGKLRLSYAKVGNDVTPFSTRPTYTITSGNYGSIQAGPYKGAYLKPEDTRSLEIGTEWRLFSNRLSLDFTWYKSNTKDQYFEFGAPLGSGLSQFFVNAGDIENKGLELALSYEVIRNTNLKWTSAVNFTRNRNKVLKLLPELGGQYEITKAGVNNYSLRIREGGSFGDIYGKKFMRADDGSIVVDDNGRPQGAATFDFLGNPNPKFMAGWSNTIEVKDFIITALIDGRFGGKVMSITQAILDEYGVSKVTADARKSGGVQIDATKASGGKWGGAIPAEVFYTTVGGRAGITEYYMYDATNVRLRELSLSYKVPLQSNTIKDIRVGLVARNLFFITKDAPYDPELSMSTGNGLQGIDVFSLPATRSFGVSARCSF